MEKKANNEDMEEFKKKYDIQDSDIILRIMTFKSKLANERNVNMSNEELFSFLDNVMNYDEMQIWLIRKEIEGVELTLNDKLKKFLELTTDERILILYDIAQNCNEKNIVNVRKLIKSSK